MKKTIIILALLCLTILVLGGCKDKIVDEGEKDKPVKAEELKEESKVVSINIGGLEDSPFGFKEVRGIWVKLQYILSDDEDYVYTIEENKAHKKAIKIRALSGNDALVEGLKAGDMLITSGYSKLSEGYPVENVNGVE